ncbi:MAG: lactate utilization protein [Bacteroidales bacterium]|nr:lactate utilization protein [Bacteroidales bacterium]
MSKGGLSTAYDNSIYADQRLSKKHLGFALKQNVEELDHLLTSFDNKWQPLNGKKYWFTNYDDLLRGLRTIVWDKNVKSYFIDDKNSYLWSEIGLLSFLKREKVKENEEWPNIQFFEVNKIIADTNQFLILGNENTIKRLNNNVINVFVVGIEQVLKNIDVAELYIKIKKEQREAEGGHLFPIFYTPSSQNRDILFILDNMRSNVMQYPKQRKALACLHCGRCNEVCPVFQCTGHKAYDNIFSGPIANILLPHLETIDDYKFVSYACTLCGNCEKVCPVSLPLRDMIMENRKFFLEKGHLSFGEKQRVKKLHKTLQNRKKLNKVAILKSLKMRKMATKELRRSRKLPKFEKQSFNQQYIKKLKENN